MISKTVDFTHSFREAMCLEADLNSSSCKTEPPCSQVHHCPGTESFFLFITYI